MSDLIADLKKSLVMPEEDFVKIAPMYAQQTEQPQNSSDEEATLKMIILMMMTMIYQTDLQMMKMMTTMMMKHWILTMRITINSIR